MPSSGLRARGCEGVILGCTEITLLVDAALQPAAGVRQHRLHAAAPSTGCSIPTIPPRRLTHALDPGPPRRAARTLDHPRDPEGHRAPGIISLAGGLPSADGFPVQAMAEACAACCATTRARRCSTPPAKASARCANGWRPSWPRRAWRASAAQVLITTGSQQGLDLVGKVLIDPGSTVAVESPTYLGALQAFSPYEADFVPVDGDDEGPLPEALDAARGARFLYLLPNFQNPSGRCLSARAGWRWRPARRWACRWSRTTPTATCGSTPRRRRR
jgi:DNA-binding transcriptional MocR family regulator